MDVSGRILRAWMPAIHAGMTEICIFMFCGRARVHETLCGEYPSSSIGCGSAAPGQSDLTAD